jgi:hypothetical protein
VRMGAGMTYSLRSLLLAVAALGILLSVWAVFPAIQWVNYNPCCGSPLEHYAVPGWSLRVPADAFVAWSSWRLVRRLPTGADGAPHNYLVRCFLLSWRVGRNYSWAANR